MLLDKGNIKIHLQGHAEKFSVNLVGKIVWIHFQLETKCGANALEIPWGWIYPVIWEQFDSTGIEEMYRVLEM